MDTLRLIEVFKRIVTNRRNRLGRIPFEKDFKFIEKVLSESDINKDIQENILKRIQRYQDDTIHTIAYELPELFTIEPITAPNSKTRMQLIQEKKYITVKEFEEVYNVSKTSQQNYRGRLYDPLPYHQKVQGGKIVYVVEEVENWFANQHK